MKDCLTHLGGNLPNRYLTSLPHYTCLGPNLYSKEVIQEGDEVDSQLLAGEPFPFKYTLPLPILKMKKPQKMFLYGKDPGLEIVYQKARWKEVIQRELGGFLQHKRFKDLPLIKKELRKKGRIKHIPSSVILLSKLLEYDPDDQFDGFYNWYYYGGCLRHIDLQGNDFLLRAGGMKFDRMDAVPIKQCESIYLKADVPNITKFDFGNKSPIHQIIADKECEYVGVRQSGQCTIVSTMEISDILRFHTVNEFKSVSSKFTSIDFDDLNKGNYATMDTAGVVCLRNIDYERSHIKQWTVPSCSDDSVDKWCVVQYGQNRDSVICTNRQYVRTYDTRAKNMNAMEFCCKDYPSMLDRCEELTCVVEGSQRSTHPLLYVSTHHKLFGMDLRFPRAFVQRWTHGMETAPSYACVAYVDGTGGNEPLEVIILRSQVTNELCAIANHPSSEVSSYPISNFFPTSLPSYSDTLRFGHWNGILLDPLTQRRLSMSTVGMCCFSSTEGVITCMSQNSVGDVFQQHLIPKANEHNVISKNVIQHLKNWEKSLPKDRAPRKKLETVVRTDMKALIKRILDKPDISTPMPKDVQADWKISKRKLFSHTDMLAERIRGAWELDDEPEWKTDEEDEEPLLPTQETMEKVNQWLGASQQVFTSTPMASQESQESVPLSFKPQLLETQFSECDNNMSPNPGIFQETKRRLTILGSGRAKRPRVDGF
ncbi:uncharacterized protein TAF1C-like [Hetaerina americana]|uniref:uncharacterized protein TAF1C-like n=1 Tax=Hetaerina americana TaxID=62018 RepID=UPI003A7F5486